MKNMRVLDLEIEDEAEKEQKLQSAEWLLFNFKVCENIPIIDELAFKHTADAGSSGTRAPATVAQFNIKNGSLFVNALFPEYKILVNNEPIDLLQDFLLDEGDQVEFVGVKYLVNRKWDMDETEARSIIGKLVMNKSTVGLRKQLEELAERLEETRYVLKQAVGHEANLQDLLEKRETNKITLQKIIKQREDLKKKFYLIREETIQLEKEKLEKKIEIASNKVQNIEEEEDFIIKEIKRTEEAIQRRDEQEAKRKEKMKEQEMSDMEAEELALQKKLEELKRKKEMMGTGEVTGELVPDDDDDDEKKSA